MKKIFLTQNQVALVDNSDFEELNKYKWFANKRGNSFYALRTSKKDKNGKVKTILMHRVIMSDPVGFDIDHIDNNGLNNQKKNLRVCTHAQNTRNRGIQKNSTSKLKGVTWNKTGNKWQAQIRVDGKYIYIGLFEDKQKAYEAYCQACVKYHGEYSKY